MNRKYGRSSRRHLTAVVAAGCLATAGCGSSTHASVAVPASSTPVTAETGLQPSKGSPVGEVPTGVPSVTALSTPADAATATSPTPTRISASPVTPTPVSSTSDANGTSPPRHTAPAASRPTPTVSGRTSSAAAFPACQTRSLRITVGPESLGGGMGRTNVVVENTSNTSCSLDGYPGVELQSNRGLIEAKREPDYRSKVVNLAVGAEASAPIGYNAVDNNGSMVADATVSLATITLPNRTESVTISVTGRPMHVMPGTAAVERFAAGPPQ